MRLNSAVAAYLDSCGREPKLGEKDPTDILTPVVTFFNANPRANASRAMWMLAVELLVVKARGNVLLKGTDLGTRSEEMKVAEAALEASKEKDGQGDTPWKFSNATVLAEHRCIIAACKRDIENARFQLKILAAYGRIFTFRSEKKMEAAMRAKPADSEKIRLAFVAETEREEADRQANETRIKKLEKSRRSDLRQEE